ncbi:protein of unknown function [Nitrospira japonica]|uniref:Uncharacterized protein n=1 Tax=Nitrospira japonica TaxID=1325564 RepID=A0A1W1I4L8_9BACT|nr:protein of unknown function [Nitrospira japonica]
MGLSTMVSVYTFNQKESCLFEGFQEGLFRKGTLAVQTGHEVNGFTDGHGDPEIQADPAMIAGGTGDLLQPVGHIRLGAQIEFHVCIDRKAIEAFLAHPAPFTVGLHEALVDAEAGPLADRTLHGGQPGFDVRNGEMGH